MRRIILIAAVILFLSHFAFLCSYFVPAISTPDANGYLGQAQLIATTGRSWFELESPLQYVGIHWLRTPSHSDREGGVATARYFSRYPPGLPVFQAFAYKILGPAAALMLDPLMATLTLVALFLLCRTWIGAGWGLLAVAVMAVNPVTNSHSLTHFAHTATAFFFLWGLVCLAFWERTRSSWWAFAAGFALGLVPAIRYPEALLMAGCALYVVLILLKKDRTWRSVVPGILGAALPLGLLMVRNHLAFGAFWKTGYALTNEQTGFGLTYFLKHAQSYLEGLQGEGVGMFLALGVAGIAGMCVNRTTWRRGVLCLALVIPSTVLYMSYYWAPSGGRASGVLRFLIPTFFIYTIAGVWLLRTISSHSPRIALSAALTLLVLSICWGLPASHEGLERLEWSSQPLADVTRALEGHAEPGSVVIAGQQIQQHLHFIGRWKLVDESGLLSPGGGRVRGMMARMDRDENAPSPMQHDKREDLLFHYQGLSENERIEKMREDLWEWAGDGGRIFWIGNEEQLRDFEDRLPLWDYLEVVETVEVPEREMEEEPRRGGRGGARFMQQRAKGRTGFLTDGTPIVIAEWKR